MSALELEISSSSPQLTDGNSELPPPRSPGALGHLAAARPRSLGKSPLIRAGFVWVSKRMGTSDHQLASEWAPCLELARE